MRNRQHSIPLALLVKTFLLAMVRPSYAFVLPVVAPSLSIKMRGSSSYSSSSSILYGMKRPILDQVASALFKLENDRVEASSEIDEKGRMGEPMEWSEGASLTNKFSEAIASNSLGYQFKQFVADITAGEYDEDMVNSKIETFINGNAVAMFSFTSCPFCRRAKDLLDEKQIPYVSIELDSLENNEGNEIRAMLGKRTKRTSVPSIFIGGQYIGGCNDGPGLITLDESGELNKLIAQTSS